MLKTDPFAVCIEMSIFNLSIKNHDIINSEQLRYTLVINEKVKRTFIKYVEEFKAIANVIDKYQLNIQTFFHVTHPHNYVYNPKYFLCREVHEKISKWITTTKDSDFETKIITTFQKIIKLCRESHYLTFDEFVNNEIIKYSSLIYSSPIVVQCLSNKLSIHTINVLTRNFGCLSTVSHNELQSVFNKKIYSVLVQKAYNIINRKFGSVENALNFINAEINIHK